VRRPERSDKVIWETVRKIAERVGVKATPHALRAAFAVQFDEANPDQLVALKELMGHARMETTLVYLRRKDKARAMEVVRDLSWGGAGHFVFPSSEEAAYKKPPLSRGFGEEAHTGFEPVSGENVVPEPLRRKLAELRVETDRRTRRGSR
jgi:hypothetical protein